MKLPFKELNVNPRGRKTGDCVIRAISMASGKPYNEVYKALFDISLATGYILNEKRVEDKLLAQYGFVKFKQPRKLDGTKYTIGEIRLLTKPFDIVVIRCAHHLTCVKEGVLIDTWNCSDKTILNYYVKRG